MTWSRYSPGSSSYLSFARPKRSWQGPYLVPDEDRSRNAHDFTAQVDLCSCHVPYVLRRGHDGGSCKEAETPQHCVTARPFKRGQSVLMGFEDEVGGPPAVSKACRTHVTARLSPKLHPTLNCSVLSSSGHQSSHLQD